jgi:hypothetical protein
VKKEDGGGRRWIIRALHTIGGRRGGIIIEGTSIFRALDTIGGGRGWIITALDTYILVQLCSLSRSLSLFDVLQYRKNRENRAANACVIVSQRQEGSIYLPMLERGTLCLPGCCDPMAYWLVGSIACACPYVIIIAVEGLLIMVLAVPSRPPSLDL